MWHIDSNSVYFSDSNCSSVKLSGEKQVPKELVTYLNDKLGIEPFDDVYTYDIDTVCIYFLSGGLIKPTSITNQVEKDDWCVV